MRDASSANGLVVCLGAHEEARQVLRDAKAPAVEVHPASWTLKAQGANEPHHVTGAGVAPFVEAVDWLSTRLR